MIIFSNFRQYDRWINRLIQIFEAGNITIV